METDKQETIVEARNPGREDVPSLAADAAGGHLRGRKKRKRRLVLLFLGCMAVLAAIGFAIIVFFGERISGSCKVMTGPGAEAPRENWQKEDGPGTEAEPDWVEAVWRAE
ncbi:MAG: hypothetical protein IK066_11555 [Kiritimatiellae bacterium]|nr:hypothetical protein [Kiritimatiellia bacterium]